MQDKKRAADIFFERVDELIKQGWDRRDAKHYTHMYNVSLKTDLTEFEKGKQVGYETKYETGPNFKILEYPKE